MRVLISLALLISTVTPVYLSSRGNPSNFIDQDRQQLWQQVEKAQAKSQPRTAIDLLSRIYESAMKDQQYPEAAKSLAKKYFLEGSINAPVAPFVIKKLDQDISALPQPIQPVMKVILANWFYNYYQQNRWRFAQRTQTSQQPSDDFETWDLPRLLNEIDRLFREALESGDYLKTVPISDYDALLNQGTVEDAYRPTLYDFIAHQAIDFYTLDEQIIRRQGAFNIDANGPVFSDRNDFVQWEPDVADDSSFLLSAIRILQSLIEFHNDDEDQSALLDADLERLNFAYQTAGATDKEARYLSALKRFATDHEEHELSALALATLAELHRSKDEMEAAHEVASRGEALFPESDGGKTCFNLIQSIEAKELRVVTEKQWNEVRPELEIIYRNIDRVYFRVVPFDFKNFRWGEVASPDHLPRKRKQEFLQREPIEEWSVELPNNGDYRGKRLAHPINFDLPRGSYVLIASANPDFTTDNNLLSLTEFWSTRLAVLSTNNYGSTVVTGQVVDAISGQPLVNANVAINSWMRDGRNSKSMPAGTTTTDANGAFSLTGRQRSLHQVTIEYMGDRFGYVDQAFKYVRDRSSNTTLYQTVFFTDRSIYRPGQTIQFKGVCIASNGSANQHNVVADRRIELVLRDVNNQEVSRRELTTNRFGSISGSFELPKGLATGQMKIDVLKGSTGSAFFRVEEYKRPKFFVSVVKPDEELKLNGNVVIRGEAKTYTGVAIDGAKVNWRVVRNVRFPDWWYWRNWWRPSFSSRPEEIAHGTTDIQTSGQFELAFEALPDLTIGRESEPVFTFSIYVDVIDSTGETRSAREDIQIGYSAIAARIACDEWLVAGQPVDLKVSTTNLNGEPIACEGKINVYQLSPPEKIERAKLAARGYGRAGRNVDAEPANPDLSKIDAWDIGDQITAEGLAIDSSGNSSVAVDLPAGAYRAVFEAIDSSGQKVKAEKSIVVFDLAADKFAVAVPHFFQIKDNSVEVGDEFVATWGTGYSEGRVFVAIEHRGKITQSFWSEKNKSQHTIRIPVAEEFRGGFQISLTFVRDNRAYIEKHRIAVPWSNKKLDIKWEKFVSKLVPGGRESWTAVISGPDAEQDVVEMVATLYDSSLDAFSPHNWNPSFNVFYQDSSQRSIKFENEAKYLQNFARGFATNWKTVDRRFRSFAPDVAPQIWQDTGMAIERLGRQQKAGFGGGQVDVARGMVPATRGLMSQSAVDGMEMEPAGNIAGENSNNRLPPTESDGVDLADVTTRKNLQETAFFFPSLISDEDGKIRIEFQAPEALTTWKFLGFAHDSDLKSALLTDTAVTSKDLMVQPNPPRFLREGDQIEFSAKIINQSPTRQSGLARLNFSDLLSGADMDERLGNSENERKFDVPAGQSTSLFWKLTVPDYAGILKYKIIGGTERLSDGEESTIPVLSKRILVTESMPIWIRGKQVRELKFEKLIDSGESDSLQRQSLTLQMTSNPAWYAVMSLPYLMEYPHQCSEQVFNRLYANSLAQHIVLSDPKINDIFQSWRGTESLDSPLEKNADLKNILIEETPWLLEGRQESQARRDVAILFDKNRLETELRQTRKKLAEMQYSDGSWPWFPGGRANDFITLYITTGFGRLRHLGIQCDMQAAFKAVERTDDWLNRKYQKLKENDRLDQNNLSPMIALYLYGRSFFLQDQAVKPAFRAAFDYFRDQASQNWATLNHRQSHGHLAIALHRMGDSASAQEIMQSLTERSISDDESGMYWREVGRSWWWYRAPIETQALMIEAYDEVLGDTQAVEECKIWLLKQKQTQHWKTTKATADAVYGLLLRGKNLLNSRELVAVELGGEMVRADRIEAGTGFYQHKILGDSILPEMGNVTVTKKDDGIAWGGLHFRYLEDIDQIEPYEGTPLKLKKSLYRKSNTSSGPMIEPVKGSVEVGDEIVTRIELRVDRDMEFVHLKDYRGSGTEPVNVLSRYRFQDGLAYYESTRDTASHFFIDYLPRGTYVFEYSVRVQLRGKYESGIAELQCMYAPEYNSHSGSVSIDVR